MAVAQESVPNEPSRRVFVAAAGAAGLAAALTACGGSDDSGSEGGTSGGATGGGDTGDADGGSLGSTADIPKGGGKVFKDQGVVVTQPSEGQFKAFSSTCTHRGCPLKEVSGGTINCTCHGSKFDPSDGSVKKGPATKPLPATKITVSGDEIKLA
ncbi:Rieske (2Fe-2S) protein [Streptomyces monticola]|uniref:Cytochrome bc1 complex Rieske iron-sulfur subunit n=1 Tax=Streptomyces monticola TaxID=2666263 RepID=A0ABW2JXB1_9ACTN